MRLAASLVLLVSATAARSAEPTAIRSAKSGAWSDAATWDGRAVPGTGARVLIRAGHRVEYDIKSDAVVRGVCVAGTLAFTPDRDTVLNVGLVKIQAGDDYSEDGFDCDGHAAADEPTAARPALEVGTAERPIDAGKTAVIRLHSVEGMNKESCPAHRLLRRADGPARPTAEPDVGQARDHGQARRRRGAARRIRHRLEGRRPRHRHRHPARTGRPRRSRPPKNGPSSPIDGTKLTLDKPLTDGPPRRRATTAARSRTCRGTWSSSRPTRRAFAATRCTTGACAGSLVLRRVPPSRQEGRPRPLRPPLPPVPATPCGAAPWSATRSGTATTAGSRSTAPTTSWSATTSATRASATASSSKTAPRCTTSSTATSPSGRRPASGCRSRCCRSTQNEGAGFWWTNSLNTFTRNVAAECDRYGFRYEATPTSSLEARRSRSASPTARARTSTSARCRSCGSTTTRSTAASASTASTSAKG